MAQGRYIRPLEKARLRGMTTERILAYQWKMMRVCATRNEDSGHVEPHPTYGRIRSKDDLRWIELRALVRKVDEREHVR